MGSEMCIRDRCRYNCSCTAYPKRIIHFRFCSFKSCQVSNRYDLSMFFCNHFISNLSDHFPQQKIAITSAITDIITIFVLFFLHSVTLFNFQIRINGIAPFFCIAVQAVLSKCIFCNLKCKGMFQPGMPSLSAAAHRFHGRQLCHIFSFCKACGIKVNPHAC